jgi:hypothetical protein
MTKTAVAPTITVAEWIQRLNVARAKLGNDTSEFANIRGRALVDPSLIPRRNELRDAIPTQKEEIEDMEAARDAAQRIEDEAAAAAIVERRKEVHGLIMDHIGEQVELVGEMDAGLDHIRTLITRSESVEAAWRALVWPLVPMEDRKRAAETLGNVKIADHADIQDAIKAIDFARSGVTVGDFRPRIENARIRAEQASGRVARALGIPVP